jgi:hypothetical protein
MVERATARRPADPSVPVSPDRRAASNGRRSAQWPRASRRDAARVRSHALPPAGQIDARGPPDTPPRQNLRQRREAQRRHRYRSRQDQTTAPSRQHSRKCQPRCSSLSALEAKAPLYARHHNQRRDRYCHGGRMIQTPGAPPPRSPQLDSDHRLTSTSRSTPSRPSALMLHRSDFNGNSATVPRAGRSYLEML